MTQSQGEMRETYPVAGEVYRYRLEESEGSFTFELEGSPSSPSPPGGELGWGLPPGITLSIESRKTGEGLCRTESGRTRAFAWAWVGAELHLWLDGDLFLFQRPGPSALSAVEGSGRRRSSATTETSGEILAPMPGAVLEVLVAEGDRVERNQTVAVMESMKMELLITAPRDGVVRRVSVQPGQRVERGMRLLELAPDDYAVK